jgi:hypothetical protein
MGISSMRADQPNWLSRRLDAFNEAPADQPGKCPDADHRLVDTYPLLASMRPRLISRGNGREGLIQQGLDPE